MRVLGVKATLAWLEWPLSMKRMSRPGTRTSGSPTSESRSHEERQPGQPPEIVEFVRSEAENPEKDSSIVVGAAMVRSLPPQSGLVSRQVHWTLRVACSGSWGTAGGGLAAV